MGLINECIGTNAFNGCHKTENILDLFEKLIKTREGTSADERN